MIAAFGNFNISRVRWRKPETRCVIIGNITGVRRDEVVVAVAPGCYALNNLSKLTHLIESYERVHLRQRLAQLAGESLRHATAYD